MTDIPVPAHQLDAVEDAPDAVECPDKAPDEVREGGKLKGGFDAREAARLRWAKERARKTDAEAEAIHAATGHAVVVRTSVQVGTIIQALARKAEKGGVTEARELRAYLSEFPIETDTDVSALDRRTRQALLAMLMDERIVQAFDDGRLDAFLADHPTPPDA